MWWSVVLAITSLIETLAPDVAIYKICKMVNPIAMQNFPSVDKFGIAVRSLNHFTNAEIQSMAQEYSIYRARLIMFADEGHDFAAHDGLTAHAAKLQAIMKFWETKWHDIPNIANLARYCMTFTPSSAAAERVFSVLKQFFSLNQMKKTLEDYVETAVMMKVNKY